MNNPSMIETTDRNELPEEPMERKVYARAIVMKYPLRHLDMENPAFPISKLEADYNLGVCSRGLSCLFSYGGRGTLSPFVAFDGSKYFSCSTYDDRLSRITSMAQSDHLKGCSRHFLHDCLRYLSLLAYVNFGQRAPELVPLNGDGISNWNMYCRMEERKLATLRTLLSKFLLIPERELGVTPEFDHFLESNSTLLFAEGPLDS